ncbi:MAG: hypothetical protein ABMA00_08755 [Gemmatimonas sp.]
MSGSNLLLAIRATIRADSDPARQALFVNLTQSSLPARLATGLHAALGTSWLSTLLVSVYGARAYLVATCDDVPTPTLLTVAVHRNARHQVNRVVEWFRGEPVARARFDTREILSLAALSRLWSMMRAPRDVLRTLRVIHRINSHHSFLVACRSASTVASYARGRALLTHVTPRAVVVSSDTNPEEIAFVAAARGLGIPTVYIAHAYPSPFSPPLRFSLSILEGDAAVDSRREKGRIDSEVVLLGVEGDSGPLDPHRFATRSPVVGLCLPKVVSWSTLADIVRDCRQVFGAREVLVRWHPSMLESAGSSEAIGATPGVTTTSGDEPLRDIAVRCDWIVADANSNVHLQVLKLGTPTVAVEGFGVTAEGRSDVYGFCANRILFPPVTSLRDVSVPDLIAFYEGDWPARFTRYDAAYLQDATAMASRARQAIVRLVAR